LSMTSKDHSEETINSWMKEDYQFIQACINHKKFIEKYLDKHAHSLVTGNAL